MNKFILIFLFLFILVVSQYKFLLKLTSKNFKIKTNFQLPNNTRLLRDTTFNRPLNITDVKSKPVDNRTIFVSIASYRDDECPNTLKYLYNNALHPKRIFVGICQQNHSSDLDCAQDFLSKYNVASNVNIIRLEDFEAKGPTYARYLCSKLYNGEDYYLQIDSHMHFIKDWDKYIIDMIDSIPYDKAVITNHPKDWKDEENSTNENVSTFCKGHMNSSGMIAYVASLVGNKGPCMEVPYCAAGFFFTYGCFLNEVPFDPNLSQLFEGEEGLFSIRLWTSGWNMYAPNRDICFHYYIRADKPKYWSNPDYNRYLPKSQYKVKLLMGLEELKAEDDYTNDFKLYGLGSVRTLQDYYKFVGFNKDDNTFSKSFCE